MEPSPSSTSERDGGPNVFESPPSSPHPAPQTPMLMQTPVLRLLDEILLEIFEHVTAAYENKPNTDTLACSSSPTWEPPFPNDSEGPAWSIMAARATCRRFCALSSHLLIRSLHFDMADSSLALLNNIASHPVFSKTVRALRVSIHEHLPPADDDDPEDAVIWTRWLQYHTVELHRCVTLSAGLISLATSSLASSSIATSDFTGVPDITRVADVAFIMLNTWQNGNLRWLLNVIPDQDFRHFQTLKKMIHERYPQQQKWLSNLTEFASTIAASLQRMPQAQLFEVGDYNPYIFLGESCPSTQRFRRHREVLARRIQPQRLYSE